MEEIIDLRRIVKKKEVMDSVLEERCKNFLNKFSTIYKDASGCDRPRLNLIIANIVNKVSAQQLKLRTGLAGALKGEQGSMASLCQRKNELRWVSSLKGVYSAIQKGLTPEDRGFLDRLGLKVLVPPKQGKKAPAFQFDQAGFPHDLLGRVLDPADYETQQKVAGTLAFDQWLKSICRHNDDYDVVMSAMANRTQAYSHDNHRGRISRNGIRHYAGEKLTASEVSESFKRAIGVIDPRTMNSSIPIAAITMKAFFDAAGLPVLESKPSQQELHL
ncbi:MAG: hypothetical protein L6Q57_03920 [Alphaproteobacteria bacterium]|nr:hypothetical protein [Alphaproteobacteria bacterium]